MDLIIRRSSMEIGGNCIELSHDSSSVLLDFGTPPDSDTAAAYTVLDTGKISAIIVSHTRQDHVGLADTLKRFADATNPEKLISIHSENPGIFKELFNNVPDR